MLNCMSHRSRSIRLLFEAFFTCNKLIRYLELPTDSISSCHNLNGEPTNVVKQSIISLKLLRAVVEFFMNESLFLTCPKCDGQIMGCNKFFKSIIVGEESEKCNKTLVELKIVPV